MKPDNQSFLSAVLKKTEDVCSNNTATGNMANMPTDMASDCTDKLCTYDNKNIFSQI